MYFVDSIIFYHICPILISNILSQMNQCCKTKRKTIVLQIDISGKTNQEELHALLASVGNDNENG